MFAMAVSLVALPVNAQALIMNLPGDEGVPHEVLIHSEVDIDLNGGPGAFQPVELWIKYPGRPDFTYIGTYTTRSNGDLDVYDFDFNETGDFECQWRLPPPSTEVSNVEIARVITIDMLAPRTTYAYIGATPNPVGVNQEVLLHVGITQQLSIVGMGWEDLSVTIERPDGKTDTISGITTDSTGGTGRVYIPDIEGNYTVQTHFPEQQTEDGKTTPGTTTGTRMLASDSEKLTLVVQAEPMPVWPGIPLPTEYWSRPIHANLYEWYTIAGNWLRTYSSGGVERFVSYNDDAPESAHILWAKPLAGGGLAGELTGHDNRTHSYECGAAYVPKFENAIVIAGVLYYERYPSTRGSVYVEREVVAVDLKTGEEVWAKPLVGSTGTTSSSSTRPSSLDGVSDLFPNGVQQELYLGQVFYWDSYNYHGVYGILWTRSGDSWYAFDAHTGRWIYTIINMPSGTLLNGPNGEILQLVVNLNAGWIALWNSSAIVSMQGSWNPHGYVYNAEGSGSAAARAWMWNVSIPTDLPGSVRETFFEDRIIGGTVTTNEVTLWGLSLEPGREGTKLFENTWNAPTDWAEGNQTISWAGASSEDKVGLVWSKEKRQRWGFSLDTGKYLWGPSESENYLGIYGRSTVIGYGKLYSTYMCGIVTCYDVKTGEVLWRNDVASRDQLSELLWGNNYPLRIAFLTDGKLYLYSGEHSPVDPKPRGAPFICLNATTGEEIWKLNGMWFYYRANPTIGDSLISILNSYDLRIYTLGKGPSATTVTAPNIGIQLGKSVLVTGTVTDVSPGTQDSVLPMRFPTGVPAVADESMNEWMQYVYMQFPRPTDVVGVDVVVSVLDPNGNSYEVGTTTSDASGFFSADFVPEVPGRYTITATFEGSKSYYGSFAEAAIIVEEAPASTPGPTPTSEPMTDLYVTGFGVGIIIAIVVVGLLLFMMLRKR